MKKFKLPKFALFSGKPKKLQATTAARRGPASENYYEEEPKTNLSSAFIVVLVLHVVAVGGIYAFNSLRASRQPKVTRTSETATASVAPLAAKANTPTPAPENAPAKSVPAPVSKATVYQVRSGDTLTKIAVLNGVSVADLEEANGLKAGVVLRPTQVLTIPAAKPVPKSGTPAVVQDSRKAAFLASKESTPAVSATRSYTVAKGDTPTSIAKKFGTTANELLALNKIDDPKKMLAGQIVKVPVKKN